MHGPDYLALFLTSDTSIPLAMLLVFGSAKLLAEICERFGQPGIVGEILAGVLIGPSVLGWLAPNDFLAAMANMGAMFLLFRVGLEVRASELMRVGGTATMVARACPTFCLFGSTVPPICGWGARPRAWEPRLGPRSLESALSGALSAQYGHSFR